MNKTLAPVFTLLTIVMICVSIWTFMEDPRNIGLSIFTTLFCMTIAAYAKCFPNK